METFLIKAAQLIAALALLVVIHEFGHYFFARLFGIRVEKFYLFFNPWFSLFKWKPKPPKKRKLNPDGTPKASWRDTEYGIGWVPLGGYCKIAGMVDESMDKEQLAQEAKPDEFRSRPAYQRLLVMVGGVMFNFILACLIYIGIAWYWGDYSCPPYETVDVGMNFSPEAQEAGYRNGDIILAADGRHVDADGGQLALAEAREVTVIRGSDTITIKNPENFPVMLEHGFFEYRLPVYVKETTPGSPAAKAGLESGDHIIAIDDVATPSFTELAEQLKIHADKSVDVTFVRDNDTIVANVTPEGDKLGFTLRPLFEIYDFEPITYNFFQAIPKGFSNGTEQLVKYVGSLKYLFNKQGAQQLGGFGAIGNLFPPKWDWRTFWEMAAFLSIILAFMNILPIPALDGGHVMFVLWEIVTRRKPSDKFLEYAQMAGMFFLLALLLYANGNDIYRFIFK